MTLPLWLRKFVVDALEGSVASIVGLNLLAWVAGFWTIDATSIHLAAPTVDQWQALGVSIVLGMAHAVVSAARRNAPDAIAWVSAKWSAWKAKFLGSGAN